MLTKYRMMDKPLMVINIHAINFKLTNFYYKKQIDQMVEQIESHYGPILVVGDFNSWKDSRRELVISAFQKVGIERVGMPEGVETFFGNELDLIFYSKEYLEPILESRKVITLLTC